MTASVVLPTYNGAPFIDEALQSIFNQTLLPSEVIVVDDASTDDTAEIVVRLARSSPIPLRYERLAVNSGSPSRPMNVGVSIAESDLIAILDHDDVYLPTKLEDEVTALSDRPEAAYAFSCSAYYHEPTQRLQEMEVLEELFRHSEISTPRTDVSSEDMLRLLLTHGCFVMGFPGFTFRKKYWALRKGIDEGLRIADHEFLCWLSSHGSACFIDRINYLRRLHGNNLSIHALSVYRDYAEVVKRYLPPSRSADFVSKKYLKVRDKINGIAYAMRDAGYYLDAFRCHHYIGSVWGWNMESFNALLKLFPHWLLHKIEPLVHKHVKTIH